MSRPLRVYQTYSVFVGNIPPDTKKYELRDLFQACGEIVDVVILNNSNGQDFGFVRFTCKESALCAVSELNHWSLNGRNIIVAIEKSTAAKIEQEKAGLPVTVTDGCGLRKWNAPKPNAGRSLGTDYITDTMYWTRLQESCTALNLKHSNITDKHLSMKRLAEDINKMKGDRSSTLWGSVEDASTCFSEISSKIMQRCIKKGDKEEALGKKNCVEFMSALRTIMKEIDTVLGTSPVSHVQEMEDKDLEEMQQLTLEGDLIREVNLELDKENEMLKHEVAIDGEKFPISSDRSVPKRLSDVSVQTSIEAEDHEMPGLKQTYCLSDTDNHVTDHLTDKQIKEAQLYLSTVGGSDNSDNDMSHLDPAIIDYHMSQLRETETRKKNRDSELKESKAAQEVDFVKDLYSKMELRNRLIGNNIERSNSRDSSLSDGSNEGNKDDSGVESDCFGVTRGRRSVGLVENMLGMNRCYGESRGDIVTLPGAGYKERSLRGSTSEPSLGQFDLEQYVMKSKGRGRGVVEAEIQSKWIPRDRHLGKSERRGNASHSVEGNKTVRVGRGIFRSVLTMKYPVGRGHPT
ncbi:uncharacterized protein LOC123556380 isoform X2 [Mercenaria mercenaria]|uniref:uncharacterized protein LOC123556380 isoform X2 n=1 Tax=Mercenaria mercenaria TaxID=6596 RepID=UPI00234F7698|nr:uncharacterized protein LOC123556380 isoform X2 [Mercenaria mercenaria]